jgi:hypothetical protein
MGNRIRTFWPLRVKHALSIFDLTRATGAHGHGMG